MGASASASEDDLYLATYLAAESDDDDDDSNDYSDDDFLAKSQSPTADGLLTVRITTENENVEIVVRGDALVWAAIQGGSTAGLCAP